MVIATINPTTGEVVQTFTPHTAAEIETIVARAFATNRVLAGTSLAERSGWMTAAAQLLENETDDVATMIVTEMGKTKPSAIFEIGKCVKALRYYADNAESFLRPDDQLDPAEVGASRAQVEFHPLGTVLCIMPWNFPLWQVLRFAAPGLMAGNTGLLKHAPSVPRCAEYLGRLFARAGFPAGAFQHLVIDDLDQVGSLIDDPRIAAVTLTGSVRAGSSVAARAGQQIKKSVLELGGSDAFIVMPSADLERASDFGVVARTMNTGQSCIAAKRYFIHTDVYDSFVEQFVAKMAATVAGDPYSETTTFGPMASERGRREVVDLVADAVGLGATVLTGGVVPDGPGWFYPATVLADVTPQMRIFGEECFGPVACLFRISTVDQAITLANESEYGLSASVWTRDVAELDQFTRQLQSGGVFLNGNTSSFPQLPFGGIKKSGYGRELSALGIREFCNVKTVWQA